MKWEKGESPINVTTLPIGDEITPVFDEVCTNDGHVVAGYWLYQGQPRVVARVTGYPRRLFKGVNARCEAEEFITVRLALRRLKGE